MQTDYTMKMEKQYVNSTMRDFWWNYRSEVIFGVVLSILMVGSYWAASFIPEDIFEIYINPFEYIAIITVCFYGAWVVLRHHDHNILRISWGNVLLIWGVIESALLWIRYGLHITAVGATPDDPLYNASLTVGNILAWLLFIYPSQILRPGWLTWKKAFVLVTPMVILSVIDYYVPADLLPLIMIFPAFIFIMLCMHVRKYRQWCEDNFSSMDNIEHQWIVRYLIILFLLGLSYYFICFWYVPNRMFTQQWLLLLILTYSTEQILFRKDPWSEVIGQNEQIDDAVRDEELSGDQSEEIRVLETWITSTKPYLNPDFQLMDIRQILPMNRTYLSHLINNAYGCSFYQLINRYRVEEAKQLMAVSPDLKLASISSSCGFSSPAVFSRVFLRETGMTPREWSEKGVKIDTPLQV